MRMKDVLGLILGGGVGSRLYPLTKERAKPAVPLAGKYRLIDVPMSNCLHAGIDKIAILTQFNSVSLHRHIYSTYNRDVFTEGWVQILAAEQTPRSSEWYQGTADAVRKQLVEIREAGAKYVLILAGDHLYRMDYKQFVQYHVDTKADVTVAVQPVGQEVASSLGILTLDDDNTIVRFTEKPKGDEQIGLESGNDPDKPFMASMGIYVFNTDALDALLNEDDGIDFGKHTIPTAMKSDKYNLKGFIFDGFWEDIGTIKRFFEVNLQMAHPDAPFDFYYPDRMIYTRPRFLPASEAYGATLTNVMLTDGCRIQNAEIVDAVIGLRSIIGKGVRIKSCVLMGADYFETEEEKAENRKLGRPHVGIGEGTILERAIVDKNARIGKNVRIRALDERAEEEHDNWVSKEGIVIIPKNAIIPDNTVI